MVNNINSSTEVRGNIIWFIMCSGTQNTNPKSLYLHVYIVTRRYCVLLVSTTITCMPTLMGAAAKALSDST